MRLHPLNPLNFVRPTSRTALLSALLLAAPAMVPAQDTAPPATTDTQPAPQQSRRGRGRIGAPAPAIPAPAAPGATASPATAAALPATTSSPSPSTPAATPTAAEPVVPVVPVESTGTPPPAPAAAAAPPAPVVVLPDAAAVPPTPVAGAQPTPAQPTFPSLESTPGVRAGDLPAPNATPPQALNPNNTGPLAAPSDQYSDVVTPIELSSPPTGTTSGTVLVRPSAGPPPQSLAQVGRVNAPPPASAAGTPQSILTLGMPDPNTQIIVNMGDFNVPAVLKWLERQTGKIILQDLTLQAGTNFNFTSGSTQDGSPATMARQDAVAAVESMLFMNGIAILPLYGRVMRAVPAAGAINRIPAYATPELLSGPPSEIVYSYFFTLRNITSDDAARQLTPLMSQGISSLISFERSNQILVTDKLQNLQRFAQILAVADVEARVREEVLNFQLENARSADVVARLGQLQTTELRRYLQTSTFVADERTNQVIVVTRPDTSAIVRNLIVNLDKNVDPKTRAEVIYLKQAPAQDMTTLLQSIVSGQQQTQQQGGRVTVRGGGAAGAPFQNIDQPAGVRGARGQVITTDSTTTTQAERDQQFSTFITIVADVRSNAIVVYGTQSDIDQVKKLVDKIDIQLAQVRIQVVITEVTLAKKQASGLSSFGINYHFIAGTGTSPSGPGGPYDIGVQTGGPTLPGVANSPQILNLSASFKDFGLSAVFNVAETDSNVRVLSDPSVTTVHNQTAIIQVTERRPIITSTTTQIQNNVAAGGSNVTSTVTYQDIGIQLQVTPLIGPDGNIVMRIDQVADNVVDNQVINGVSQPIIGHRQAGSVVTIKDGELLVLAGMQRVEKAKTNSKVYILGDIPIIGNLFRPKTDDDKTVELIIFVRPTIVASSAVGDVIAEQTARDSLVGDTIASYLQTGSLAEVPEPPSTSSSSSSQTPAPRAPSQR